MGKDAYVGGEAVACCVCVSEGGGGDDTWVGRGLSGLVTFRCIFVLVVQMTVSLEAQGGGRCVVGF